MKPPYSDRVDALINAMQLCIKSPISGATWDSSKNRVEIGFDSIAADDNNLKKIKKLLPLEEEYECGFKIKPEYFKSDQCQMLTTFLLLTRLDDRNARAMGALDSNYASFLNLMGQVGEMGSVITNSKEAAAIVFKVVEKRQLTLRELSQKTGLTQVTLSNFKSGKSDLRLATFLRIISALGMKLKLERSKIA